MSSSSSSSSFVIYTATASPLRKLVEISTDSKLILDDDKQSVEFKAARDYYTTPTGKGFVVYQHAQKMLPETEVDYVLQIAPETTMTKPDLRSMLALNRLINRICHACESKANVKKMSRCVRCKLVYYCNRECQQSDWYARHKQWCCNQDAPLDAMPFRPAVARKDKITGEWCGWDSSELKPIKQRIHAETHSGIRTPMTMIKPPLRRRDWNSVESKQLLTTVADQIQTGITDSKEFTDEFLKSCFPSMDTTDTARQLNAAYEASSGNTTKKPTEYSVFKAKCLRVQDHLDAMMTRDGWTDDERKCVIYHRPTLELIEADMYKMTYTRANASSNKTVAACMKLQKPDMPKELF